MRFAFAAHNIEDFSATNIDNNLPHPGIAACCSKIESLLTVNPTPGVTSEALATYVTGIVKQHQIREDLLA